MHNYYQNTKYSIGGARKKVILELVAKKSPAVLDIGCGNGELGEALKKEKQAAVWGVEISQRALKEAEQKLEKVFLMDIEEDNWPEEIKSQKFDYIIISEVLEHLFSPEKALKKIKQLAHKETEIIITVPNILFWKNRLKILAGHFEYTNEGLMDWGHLRFFSWHSLQRALWQIGYEIIETKHIIPTRGTKWLGKIFPNLFAYQFVVRARRKRKVAYTAIFGNKDELLEPEFINPQFDYICFTDNPNFSSDVWQIRKISLPVAGDFTRSARKVKILPHRHLSEYDISVWVDGNMLIRGDLNELTSKYLNQANMAIYAHQNLPYGEGRDCIFQEADALLKMAKKGKIKDNPEVIKKQIKHYQQEGYPPHNGLISSMAIVRRHNAPDIIRAMEDWWQEVKKFSKRDQLSFDYIKWKHNLRVEYLPGNSRNNKYFLNLPHKDKLCQKR